MITSLSANVYDSTNTFVRSKAWMMSRLLSALAWDSGLLSSVKGNTDCRILHELAKTFYMFKTENKSEESEPYRDMMNFWSDPKCVTAAHSILWNLAAKLRGDVAAAVAVEAEDHDPSFCPHAPLPTQGGVGEPHGEEGDSMNDPGLDDEDWGSQGPSQGGHELVQACLAVERRTGNREPAAAHASGASSTNSVDLLTLERESDSDGDSSVFIRRQR
jgi:hypothetical protein